jgi:hypothetical protein
MIVGAEAFSSAEITELSCRGHVVGRDSVDVDVDPPVDHRLPIHRPSWWLNFGFPVHDDTVERNTPAIAPIITTTMGGVRHAVNSTNPMIATLTSAGWCTELVHTGV